MTDVCLSDLPDDLLCRILYFVPLKEAASTSALARQWRTLWLQSSALNLDSRTRYPNVEGCCYTQRAIFRRDAKAAMAAYCLSGLPVKKLTFYYEETVEDDDDDDGYEDEGVDDEEDDDSDDDYYYSDEIQYAKSDMVYQLEEFLSSPTAYHLEELYFGIGYYWGTYCYDIATLPSSKTLSVLHITNCSDIGSPPDTVVAFPRLTELRLRLCDISREILQAIIDASPLLTTLQLDGGSLFWYPYSQHFLSLPKVTTLLIQNFDYVGNRGQGNLELDAPNLRRFTYKGPVPALSLKSAVPHMTQVELQFDVSDVHRNSESKDVACHLFWQLLSNFGSAKMLILSFEPPDQYAPDDV